MRNLILTALVLLGLIISGDVFASGKLQLTGNYFTKDGRALPSAGISAYEHVLMGIYYDGFLGFGVAPRHNYPDVYWMTFRQDLSVPVTDIFSISAGVTFRYSDQEWIGLEDESNVHVKAVFKLWE